VGYASAPQADLHESSGYDTGESVISKVGAGILRVHYGPNETTIEAAMWPSQSASFVVDTCSTSGFPLDLSEFSHDAQVAVGKRRAKRGQQKGRALVLIRNGPKPKAVAIATLHIGKHRPILIRRIEFAGRPTDRARLSYEAQLLKAVATLAASYRWGDGEVDWQHDRESDAKRVEKQHNLRRRPVGLLRKLGYRPPIVSYRPAD
jgi:hypothetical protein